MILYDFRPHGFQLGAFCPPLEGPFRKMPGGTCRCHSWGGSATAIWWLAARNAARHSTTAPPTKNYLAQNVNSATDGKPWFQHNMELNARLPPDPCIYCSFCLACSSLIPFVWLALVIFKVSPVGGCPWPWSVDSVSLCCNYINLLPMTALTTPHDNCFASLPLKEANVRRAISV